MTRHRMPSLRSIVSGAALMIASVILLYIVISEWHRIVTWTPGDYGYYFLSWGQDAQKGIYNYRYPLPALLWIFLPLSLLPTWFALVWTVLPFLIVLYMFGKKGIAVWLSYPFLLQATFGNLDGLLLLPTYWLIRDDSRRAGVSAALLSLKPQLAIFLVPFMIYRWLRTHNWNSLLLFCSAMALLYLPAFLIDPSWPAKMIIEDQVRATEPIQTTRGATLWGWWWHGDWMVWALPLVVALIVVLVIGAFRSEWKQARTVHLLDLMSVPVLYTISLVGVIPTLENSTFHLLTFTAVSWVGVAIDTLAGGWGGAYVLIPLTSLVLLAVDHNPLSNPPPHEKLCA